MRIRRSTNLTEGVIWEQILFFAIPLFLTNFLQQLYNAADLVIVGQFAGKEAMAAVGATGSISNMIIGMFMGLATGCSVVIAQKYGAGDYKGLYRAVHSAYCIAILGGIVLTIVGVIFTPNFLGWMGTPVEIIDDASKYMRLIFAGMIPLLMYNIAAGILRAVGNSRSPFFFLAFSVTCNIAMDLLFVAGFKMGVLGAALATFIAQLLASLFITWHLCRRDTAYRLHIKQIRLYRDVVRQIISIGIPAGLQSSVISLSNVLIQTEINSFGPNAIAGIAAAGRIDGFNFTALDAFAMAATTFSGQNLGAGLYDRVKKGARVSIGIVVLVSVTISAIAIIFVYPLLGLFNQNAEVLEYGANFMLVLAPFYWILGISQVMTGFVRGAGKSVLPMISALTGMCVLRMIFIYGMLAVWHNVRVIAWAYPFSWFITFSINFVYYMWGKWMPKKVEA